MLSDKNSHQFERKIANNMQWKLPLEVGPTVKFAKVAWT